MAFANTFAGLKSELQAASAVTDLLTDGTGGIWPLEAPEAAGEPFILIQRVSTQLDAIVARQMSDERWQVSVVGSSLQVVQTIAEAVHGVINGATLTVSDFSNFLCLVDSVLEFAPDTRLGEQFYRVAIEVKIMNVPS